MAIYPVANIQWNESQWDESWKAEYGNILTLSKCDLNCHNKCNLCYNYTGVRFCKYKNSFTMAKIRVFSVVMVISILHISPIPHHDQNDDNILKSPRFGIFMKIVKTSSCGLHWESRGPHTPTLSDPRTAILLRAQLGGNAIPAAPTLFELPWLSCLWGLSWGCSTHLNPNYKIWCHTWLLIVLIISNILAVVAVILAVISTWHKKTRY